MCDADFNNDGVVNYGDLNILQAKMFSSEATHTDMNGDGVCNMLELGVFQMYFGGEVAAQP